MSTTRPKVLVIVAKRLDRIEEGKERAFLFAVAMNVAAHARRSLARGREVSDDSGVLAAANSAPDAEAHLTREENRRLLDRVLDGLSRRSSNGVRSLRTRRTRDGGDLRSARPPSGTVASRLRRAREAFHAAAMRERAR